LAQGSISASAIYLCLIKASLTKEWEVFLLDYHMKFLNMLDYAPLDREVPDDDANLIMVRAVMSEEEARVATLCSWELRTCEDIASDACEDPEYLREVLERLVYLGSVHNYAEDGVTMKYQLCIWAPGFSEHLMQIPEQKNPEFAKLWLAHTHQITKSYIGQAPMGYGVMRVVPIDESIEAKPVKMSWEDLQTYLDKSDLYSATTCNCRLAQKLVGNGCEHPIEDMCIQIGPEADYYIRTGRGKKLNRAEVEAQLRKAEQAGLAHEVFSITGRNESTFICNCCGCSCVTLRTATLFQDPDPVRSNFVAKVDPDKCVGCGTCVENCNANAAILGSGLCDENQVPEYDKPYDTEWSEDNWDHNYRNRTMVNSYGTAPCKTECPAHISVQGYIRKAHEGKFDEALKIIKRENPFPAVCGRICPHNCEKECTRAQVDEAIAIDDIKKFIADRELETGNRFIPEIKEKRNGKVAVIGSGPAGLTCAYYAAVDGFDVTVFEKQDVLGGMMTLGIPNFRLEKDVINAEIDVLRELGVKFVTGVEIGKNKTISDLRSEGYNAFFIGIGAQGGRKLGVEGESAQGVISGIDFLRNIALGTRTNLQGKTLVVGGGNVAIDVARTAVRMCDSDVELVCLEQKEEMPALPDEQDEASGEGISFRNGWGPKRVLAKDGNVVGVELSRCVSVFDDQHRFAPVYDENDTIIIDCDNVIAAIGQGIETGGLLEGTKIETGRGNTIVADAVTLQTADEDIFAGGDILTGPKFTIDAIASGKSASISIRRYLLGLNMMFHRDREFHSLNKESLKLDGFDRMPRQRKSEVSHEKAKSSFKDLRVGLTEEQITKETSRCLGCGISVVDEFKCLGCGACAMKCEFDAIKLVRNSDSDIPVTTSDWVADRMRYAQEREGRIAAKKAL